MGEENSWCRELKSNRVSLVWKNRVLKFRKIWNYKTLSKPMFHFDCNCAISIYRVIGAWCDNNYWLKYNIFVTCTFPIILLNFLWKYVILYSKQAFYRLPVDIKHMFELINFQILYSIYNHNKSLVRR